MKHPLCLACGLRMERHGKTAAGTERYHCPKCKKTTIIHRTDTRKRHLHDHFVAWLTGTDSKQKITEKLGWLALSTVEGNTRLRQLVDGGLELYAGKQGGGEDV